MQEANIIILNSILFSEFGLNDNANGGGLFHGVGKFFKNK